MPRLPAGPVRGALVALCIGLNTVVHALPLFLVALAKLAVPITGWRLVAGRWLTAIAENWIAFNTALLRATQEIRWEFSGLEGLSREHWYLVIANHRSWVDILAVQAALNRRVPFLKFFIKEQLRWVPILGVAWWALDMPFMKRYSRAQVERRPELRGVDLETTRRACEKFRDHPTSIINFVEGTRYTQAKWQATDSPYRHLLKPRPGGIAFVFGAMGPTLKELLDVTIAYPEGCGGFWDLCCGNIRHIVVEVERQPLDAWLAAGDYAGDPVFRERFRVWLDALWAAKDARLRVWLSA